MLEILTRGECLETVEVSEKETGRVRAERTDSKNTNEKRVLSWLVVGLVVLAPDSALAAL